MVTFLNSAHKPACSFKDFNNICHLMYRKDKIILLKMTNDWDSNKITT